MGFAPVPGATPNFGAIPDRIWLRIPLEGAAAAPRIWFINFNMNFTHGIPVHLMRAGGPDELLVRDLHSVFDDHPIKGDELAARFALAPGERATLYVSYWSGRAMNLPLTVVTENRFLGLPVSGAARHYAFYGVMIAMAGAGLICA